MPKLFSFNRISLADGTDVPPHTVFDASVADAKQFDKLGAARPATQAEIKAADDLKAEADGMAFLEEVAIGGTPGDATVAPEISATIEKPDSEAPGDPQSKPKAR